MAVATATVSATPLSTYRSIATNALVCVAAGDSLTMTLVHRLGACPHEIRPILRSVISAPSGVYMSAQVTSWNASQGTLNFAHSGAAPALQAQYDVICEQTHSLCQ